MNHYNYNLSNTCYKSLSMVSGSMSPHIFGFTNLSELLKWYVYSNRSCGSVSSMFLPDDVQKIYFSAKPIISFRRDRINEEKLEKVFTDFQQKRDSLNEYNRNNANIHLFDFTDFENPLGYLNDYIEKNMVEEFLKFHPNHKYFSICSISQIVVKKEALEKNSIKENPLDVIINSENALDKINSNRKKKYRKQNRPTYSDPEYNVDFSSNHVDNDCKNLEDNSNYRWDLDMDQQSPEFWDSL